MPSFRPFKYPALFAESFLTSSSYDDDENDDDDDDDDDDDNDGNNNKKQWGGGGRVKTEQEPEYALVVWWTPLACEFLACVTVYDKANVQIGYSTEYFYFLL